MPQKRILIIEDNGRMRALLSILLENEGYEVLEAEDGKGGLELARTGGPDLIILDLKLPGLDGEDVCAAIRKDPNLAQVPIIMLTVKAHITEKLAGFRLGADDYISKPFDTRELVVRVQSHLRRSLKDRMVNPKTLLPGRFQVTEAVERRIDDDEEFALLRVDLDDLALFNSTFGLKAGDEALKILAEAVIHATGDSGDHDAFVGHFGEDDFVAVSSVESAKSICQGIIDRFETDMAGNYSPEERRSGYYLTHDRRGNQKKVPLLSLSIGVATRRSAGVDNFVQLLSVATEVLKYCKKLPGSNYFADRRAGTESGSESLWQVDLQKAKS